MRGTSALETAAVLPVLLLVLTAMADHAWLSLVQHQMGHAARMASRYGITGQADPLPTTAGVQPPMVDLCDGNGGGARVDRLRAIVAAHAGAALKLDDLCLSVGSYSGYQGVGRPEPIADINGNGRWDTGEAFTDINGNGRWDPDQATPSPGGNDAIGVYTLRYETWPLTGVTPGLPRSRAIVFEARVVVRNEPF